MADCGSIAGLASASQVVDEGGELAEYRRLSEHAEIHRDPEPRLHGRRDDRRIKAVATQSKKIIEPADLGNLEQVGPNCGQHDLGFSDRSLLEAPVLRRSV